MKYLRPMVSRLIAIVGILTTWPIWVGAAVGVLISDGWPVFYRAPRVGKGGTPFTMYKFRTMKSACEGRRGPRITSGTDPRVFAWGRLLRRLKVDELPQLVNVLRGDMAIVGPRPEDPLIVEEAYAPWMMETLVVLPGLTSPGSLGYFASENLLPPNPEDAERTYVTELLPRKLAVDLVYVRGQSLGYDLSLIVRTIAAIAGQHNWFSTQELDEAAGAEAILQSVET